MSHKTPVLRTHKSSTYKAIADFGLIVYGDPWTPEAQLKEAA